LRLLERDCIQYAMRSNLSHALEDAIRARIDRGELPAGSRINEVHVAAALGVSRTPVREALTRLSGESLVEMRPKHGFYVRPMSADELGELYAIRLQLDPWALRLAGLPGPAVIDQLEAINAALAATTDASVAIDRDDEWHLLLLAHCPNRVLLGLIRQMMWRTRRYEHVYFSSQANRTAAVGEHARLIEMLRAQDLEAACGWLTANMSTAVPVLAQETEGA
jgi:DNA-binding GntR family transcriptional regulator